MVHNTALCLLVMVVTMDSFHCLTVDDLAENLKKLESKVKKLGNKLDTSLQEVKDKRLAFLAELSAETAPASGPYIFDKVVFNDGNGFDPTRGIFTAPFTGVYLFSCQIFTRVEERPLVDIMQNGNVLVRMRIDTRGMNTHGAVGEESTSSSVTVKLFKGDRVWVQGGDRSFIRFWAGYHTFFTGFLLYVIAE